MKILGITLIFILILCSNSLLSQEFDYSPCLPDCENDGWQPPLPQLAPEVTVNICGFDVKIRYRYRIACGVWHDYYIETVGTGNNDLGHILQNCFGWDMNAMMQAVSEALMIANPASFPPNAEGECEDMWRVMKGGCMTHFYYSSVNPSFPVSPPANNGIDPATYSYTEYFAPCIENDCCLEMYTVCKEVGGNLNITLTDYQPPINPDCDQIRSCYPVCGSIHR